MVGAEPNSINIEGRGSTLIEEPNQIAGITPYDVQVDASAGRERCKRKNVRDHFCVSAQRNWGVSGRNFRNSFNAKEPQPFCGAGGK